ncbi:glycoside hydrolase, partial [Paenibacillus sepulcri]|nr:glycoside hydrolase [Paenibacillus sepulcri]
KDTGAAGTAGFAVASLTAADSTGAETGLAGGSWTVSIRHIDKTALAAVIAEAQAAHDAAAEGTAAGQYPAGSKAELQAAIDDAKAVAADSAATDEQVEQAAASLAESLQAFRDAVIKTRPGDMNDDDKVTVGDLAIIAAAYGRTAADPNWPQYAKSDLNADGLIDIEDLSAMARLIFG